MKSLLKPKKSGMLWAMAVSVGEGRGRTVVTRAGVVAVTVRRVAWIEVGHRSREGASGSKWDLDCGEEDEL